MTMTAAALWLNTVFASFDYTIMMGVHKLYDVAGWFFSPFSDFISFFGKGGVMLILLSFALMFFPKTRKIGTAMLLGISIGAIFTNCFLKIVIARPRPYIANEDFKAIWQTVGARTESDKSFPSGHTTAAFSTMMALFLAGNRKVSWTAFIFAFLMGFARIYLVVHYPSDVLGGIIVGSIAGILGYIISVKFVPAKFYEMNFVKLKEGKHLSK